MQTRLNHKKVTWIELITLRSWWVYSFSLISLIGLYHGMRGQDLDFSRLEKRKAHLEARMLELQDVQKDLKDRLMSQNDPSFLELILKKELGLIEEGQTKILFKQR